MTGLLYTAPPHKALLILYKSTQNLHLYELFSNEDLQELKRIRPNKPNNTTDLVILLIKRKGTIFFAKIF